MLVFFLGLELFRLIDVGVCNLEPAGSDPGPSDETGNEMFLVDTVAVPERVSVEQDIARHGSSGGGEEEMDPASTRAREPWIGTVEGGIAV